MAFTQHRIGGTYAKNSSQFFMGRVKHVILGRLLYDGKIDPNYSSPADVGKISYEIVHNSGLGHFSSAAKESMASPIFSFVKQYPVIGEIVLLVKGPSVEMNDDANAQITYYFPPYNIWNSPNHNVFPNMAEYANFVYDSTKGGVDNRNAVTEAPEMPKGFYFKESDIRRLKPFEGDTIIEGRFGQSVRFGSSSPAVKNQSPWSGNDKTGPVTIIRNGQGEFLRLTEFPDEDVLEDPNTDGSSIYMTSGQEIILEDLNLFSFESYGVEQSLQIDRRVEKIESIVPTTEITSPKQHDKA